ncbi:signal peptidase I [Candidatus Parcubacteria bacterium]|nr:signal peptidase I [Candidatus Parcubacteria bacterium]
MELDTAPAKDNERDTGTWREWVKFAIIAALIVIPFRRYVAQPFVVEGASMDPTFHNSEYLVVDELTYHFKTPERGSVLIFRYPKDPSKYFIKRVIGLPGETVRIDRGRVTVVNQEYPEGFVLDEPYVKLTKDDSGVYTLESGEYFVMGDNRAGSADSRMWGSVPEANIIGRPIIRLWPFAILPGNQDEKN